MTGVQTCALPICDRRGGLPFANVQQQLALRGGHPIAHPDPHQLRAGQLADIAKGDGAVRGEGHLVLGIGGLGLGVDQHQLIAVGIPPGEQRPPADGGSRGFSEFINVEFLIIAKYDLASDTRNALSIKIACEEYKSLTSKIGRASCRERV